MAYTSPEEYWQNVDWEQITGQYSEPQITPPPETFPPATPLGTEEEIETGTRLNWYGISRSVVALLDAGISIYDAIQVSRQREGYLPPEYFMSQQIRGRYPGLSEEQIRRAMLQAETSPRQVYLPPDIERKGFGGMPDWIWLVVGGIALILIAR